MLQFKWWNKEIDEINQLIPPLTESDLEKVKEILKNLLETGENGRACL